VLALGDEEDSGTRLDIIYHMGMAAQDDDPAAATSFVAQVLYDSFGVLPDHYLTLDLTRLAEMIDAVDGVDVQVLSDYDATQHGLPYFQVGEMHMQGELALAYAAATSYDARWDGLERQTQVLKALRDKVFSPAIIPKTPELIERFRLAVTTDLSIQQGLDLACLADQVSIEQVTFTGVGNDLVRTEPDGSLAPDVEGVIRLLIETFGEL
jgi:anionic cell wall polymer biosynthesis LytR-Cps2A-Psr (LCP) family protein